MLQPASRLTAHLIARRASRGQVMRTRRFAFRLSRCFAHSWRKLAQSEMRFARSIKRSAHANDRMLIMDSKTMRANTQQIYQERILRVLKHLETNLDRAITLDELAKL